MKLFSKVLALCFVHANVWVTTAFSVNNPPKASSVVLKQAFSTEASTDEFFPLEIPPMVTIQGENTVRTFGMPVDQERAEMVFKSNGRPLKAEAQLWLGPLRKTHTMKMDIENGALTPFRAILKFKKGGQTLRVETTAGQEFPCIAGVRRPDPERNALMAANTEKVWDSCTPEQKKLIQGGQPITTGFGKSPGAGSIHTWEIPPNVKSVQFLCWAFYTGKKSFKMNIEVLQGPNNVKQKYFLQCGGGSQPYHCIFMTPGPGAKIRIQNKKFVEDGLYQAAVVPYEMGDPEPPMSSQQWWM